MRALRDLGPALGPEKNLGPALIQHFKMEKPRLRDLLIRGFSGSIEGTSDGRETVTITYLIFYVSISTRVGNGSDRHRLDPPSVAWEKQALYGLLSKPNRIGYAIRHQDTKCKKDAPSLSATHAYSAKYS